MSKLFRAEVVSNLTLNDKNNLLTLKPLEKVLKPEPGQFYMIEVSHTYDPLLKRPFSYLRRRVAELQFLYAVRGRGTSLMKKFKEGMVINMIGPLGRGYPRPRKDCMPLLVAGGTGIAPIFSLAEELPRKAYILHGAKCRDELILMDELMGLGMESFLCTDDGSFGVKGTVADALYDFLMHKASPSNHYVIFACGPRQMLEAVARVASEKGIRGYASLEENMACGFGACLGCAVKTIHGYKRVCKEGPVFPIEDIVW
ncbi:MAG: dihydroorotate dehydrogenase electron transfer subunit [Nitrospirota bacterium]